MELGTKVIVRSNEEKDPLKSGNFVGDARDLYGLKSYAIIPVVALEDGELTMGGVVLPYSASLWEQLQGMDPKDQWEYLCLKVKTV